VCPTHGADNMAGGFLDMMLPNTLSPARAAELLGGFVPGGGVIAPMTWELGSIANSTGGWQRYSASKAALDMLTKAFATTRPGGPRALLLVAPGWVQIEASGPDFLVIMHLAYGGLAAAEAGSPSCNVACPRCHSRYPAGWNP
jgi:NAD(P)-dependent dehydrogenase (short-subunit alcohol dehydrogenase family)